MRKWMSGKAGEVRLRAFREVCFIVVFLWSCSGNLKDDSTSGKKIEVNPNPVTVRFLGQWKNEGARELLVRNIAREYEFSHPGIHVDLQFPEDVYYHREDPLSNQKFVASIIKEENPQWDIIRINNEYQAIDDVTGDLEWSKKALVDFSEIEEFRQNTLPELLTDSVKKLWHGIIPGPFTEGVNWALWCNNAVADKLGIKVKQFDMTFDDFLGYMKAANEYNKTHKDYIIPLFESVDWKTTLALGFQLYASQLNDLNEFFTDRVTEDKLTAWGKTLSAMEQLASFGALSDKADTMHWEKGKNMILNDQCLFFSNGSWMYNLWGNVNPKKMRDIMPTEYPVFKPTQVYIGAYQIMWAVLKKAPHREEAVKFLLAWNKPSVADQWERYTKCPTGTKGSFSSSLGGKDQFSLFTEHIATRYGARKYPYNPNSEHIFGVSKKDIPNYFDEVLQGKLTSAEAMRKIRKSVGK